MGMVGSNGDCARVRLARPKGHCEEARHPVKWMDDGAICNRSCNYAEASPCFLDGLCTEGTLGIAS